MIADMPKATGGGDKKSDHRVRSRPSDQPTLAEQGIDKHLADRARKAAEASPRYRNSQACRTPSWPDDRCDAEGKAQTISQWVFQKPTGY
jgi:hypothetical protein